MVTIVASVIPLFFSKILTEGFISFVVVSLVCCISSLLSILMIGCTRTEKQIIYNQLNRFLKIVKIRR